MKFYNKPLPSNNEVNIAKINNISNEYGIIEVNILEYGIIGNIFMNNLAKKEKNINKFIKKYKNIEFPCYVYDINNNIPNLIPIFDKNEEYKYKKRYFFHTIKKIN